jgi:hypothetical protein
MWVRCGGCGLVYVAAALGFHVPDGGGGGGVAAGGLQSSAERLCMGAGLRRPGV